MKWYDKGLFFKCIQCGKCCTGFPGFIWILKDEIKTISSFLHIKESKFFKKYTKIICNKISLKEILPSYDCIFLKNKKCSIYKVRPLQCKTSPFWPQNMISKKAWEDNIEKHCPGAKNKTSKISKNKIEEILKKSKRVF